MIKIETKTPTSAPARVIENIAIKLPPRGLLIVDNERSRRRDELNITSKDKSIFIIFLFMVSPIIPIDSKMKDKNR